MKNIFMKLLSLNVILTILIFFLVNKVDALVIYAVIGYVFISTPIYIVLTYLKLKNELKNED